MKHTQKLTCPSNVTLAWEWKVTAAILSKIECYAVGATGSGRLSCKGNTEGAANLYGSFHCTNNSNGTCAIGGYLSEVEMATPFRPPRKGNMHVFFVSKRPIPPLANVEKQSIVIGAKIACLLTALTGGNGDCKAGAGN